MYNKLKQNSAQIILFAVFCCITYSALININCMVNSFQVIQQKLLIIHYYFYYSSA